MTSEAQGEGGVTRGPAGGPGWGVAPPTAAGAMPPPRSRWPDVLGVVLMVFGVLGALNGLLSLASLLITPLISSAVKSIPKGNTPGAPDLEQTFASAEKWAPWTGVTGALQLIAGLLLLWAALAIKARRRVGPPRALWWAAFKSGVVLLQTWVVYASQTEAMAAVQATMAKAGPGGTPMPGFVTAIQSGAVVFGSAVTLLWGLALPIFVVVWLRLAKVRGEVGGWGA